MKKINQLIIVILVAITALLAFYFVQNPTKTTSETSAQTEVQPHQLWVQEHSPIMGAENATVTLVEFMDPACEACRAMYPYVKKIMSTYPDDIRLVIRYVDFHKQSEEAVRILEAARKQNLYQDVLEVLLAFQPAWAPHGKEGEDMWEFLTKTELDIDQAKQDAKDPAIAKVIALDMADFHASGSKKTPSFFINGKPLELMHPDALLEMIEAEIQPAK